MNLENRQKEIYGSQTCQELTDYYNKWAKDYEQELVDDCRYIAPEKVLAVLSQFVSKDAKILDAGAGTGLVGKILYQKGYSNLEGIDISAEMLEQAEKKNVYTALYQKVMGEPLGFPSDSFDAIVSVGVFTYGHAPSCSFDELLRIAKPGGYIIFTLRLDFYENSDFKQKLTALEESGKWTLVEISEKFSPLSTAKPDGYYRVWVYQVS
ncbi:Methyltransferase domain family [Coleofasciculus chthonoplastes PCC 7420]|uniref:Methyltransferase domain family n=1 Tax=Coleofasciculus chthonoplastes PCC 7420 TaxID=118168 RepID=B4W069_9CYAN|nr:class I SAM-dependent methyltransferase [Coleofasciculus chthonoplastes]EDX72433.1 Methyltransferase domain family [Coleofasciculus chthonoplastes PCC 7420]